MERPLLFTIIFVSLLTCLANGTDTDRHFSNMKNVFIFEEILQELLAIEGGRNLCENNCYPGQCMYNNGEKSCLCPEGYYSDKRNCKEIEWNCNIDNCKPGKCIKELSKESCLCPEGFTSKAKRCIEITYSDTKRLSTIMLMIIIAIATMMFTMFLCVCVWYFARERNY